MHGQERLLAVGGVHAFEGTEPCHLTNVEPASALEDLHWQNGLVVRAREEGRAELACGEHRARMRVVTPAQLELRLVDDHVVVGQRFHVRAVPHDRAGHELEIGKWTELTWRADEGIEREQSSGEFGQCDSCFGMAGFRATTAKDATIEARLGAATGALRVTVRPQ